MTTAAQPRLKNTIPTNEDQDVIYFNNGYRLSYYEIGNEDSKKTVLTFCKIGDADKHTIAKTRNLKTGAVIVDIDSSDVKSRDVDNIKMTNAEFDRLEEEILTRVLQAILEHQDQENTQRISKTTLKTIIADLRDVRLTIKTADYASQTNAPVVATP